MAIPVLLLRAELTELLTGLLGIYTFANGVVTPAVRVIEDDDTTRAQVEGLELVISRQPNSTPVSVYNEALCERRWDLWLKDWSSSNARATEAAERIVYRYPGSTITPENSFNRKGLKRVLRVSFADSNLVGDVTGIPPASGDYVYVLDGDFL